MSEHGLLGNALIYLAAAVLVVPLAKRLGIGAVLGYLIAGVIIGPAGYSLITNVEDILHFSEFGVVLLLFLIGLELNPRRLWSMRRVILGTGGGQVVATTLLLWGVGWSLGLSGNTALIVGMGLSLSSTALALQTLTERNLLTTPGGHHGFATLLFQDIAVVPMLALIPLLGADSGEASGDPFIGSLKVIAVIIAIVVGGHYLTRPVFRYIAKTQLREIFTAFSLLLVIGIALLMQQIEMSMALGAFLAGVLLAESEYRHELEVEIEPFKGLLLGLFFISVGMSIDFSLLWSQPALILGLVVGLVTCKGLVLWLLARVVLPARQRPLFSIVLSQGGEFAFVLFAVAASAGVLTQTITDQLVLVVALSMVTTPLLLLLNERLFEPRNRVPDRELADETIDEQYNPVIIAGFGRFGRVVGRLLHANQIGTTILDHDPDHIEHVREYGYKVYYGDISRVDILRSAGAEQAKLLILAVDDLEAGLRVIDTIKEEFPQLTIMARARDMVHAFELKQRGVEVFQRELFESALSLGEQALKGLGFGAYRARRAKLDFRDHDQALFQALFEADALEKRISISKEAQDDLQKVLEGDQQALMQGRDQGW